MRIPKSELSEKMETKSKEENLSCEDNNKFSFTPQQAHIFGGQSIFLSFTNLVKPLEEEEDIFYYIVFKGSNLRHITSAKVLNPYTLQAVIPEHDEAELVILTVYNYPSINYSKDDSPNCDNINVMASDTFVFTSDSTQFLSQQLANNAATASELLNLENVYASLLDIPANEKHILDAKLTTSFRKMKFPSSWSIETKEENDMENWTLLHFSAKHNLPLFAEILMSKKGSDIALKTLDKAGHTPVDIAIHMNNKKLTEIFSRNPCIEEDTSNNTTDHTPQPQTHPCIKRHKLGTTTITNTISEDKEHLEKDLMLLKELDKLAAASQEPTQENGIHPMSEEASPLTESLKKLHEINEEIRRLRSISYKDQDPLDEYDKSPVDHTDTNGNVVLPTVTPPDVDDNDDDDEEETLPEILDETTDNINSTQDTVSKPEDESFVDLTNTTNDTSIEDSLTQNTETDQSIEPLDVPTTETSNENSNDTISNISDSVLDEQTPPSSPPELERRLSNISVGKVENVEITDVIEILPTAFEEVTPIIETVVSEIEVTDVDADLVDGEENDDEANSTPELNFKLESVTEETEEELQADGSTLTRKPRYEHSQSLPQTRSLDELPPHPPKRVGILKKSGNRPLSDSFENLKMVESQGIVELYEGNVSNVKSGSLKDSLTRGHSLDALMGDVDNQSEPSTTSQVSLNGHNDSQDSLTSDYDSPQTRSRCGSDKLSVHSYKASSLLSLDDIPRYASSGSSHEDLRSIKKGSLLSKITFKKAKSMSSLEIEKNKKQYEDEERRKTFTSFVGDILPSKPQLSINNSHRSKRIGRAVSFNGKLTLLKQQYRQESRTSDDDDADDDENDGGDELQQGITGDLEEVFIPNEIDGDLCGNILVRCEPCEETGIQVKKSQSTHSIDSLSTKEEKQTTKKVLHKTLASKIREKKFRRVSTSNIPKSREHHHDEQATKDQMTDMLMRKTSTEGKRKKLHIFGSGKPKDKKEKGTSEDVDVKNQSSKEKDKKEKEKDLRERKDSDGKNKKKVTSKTEATLPVKQDSKAPGFLAKRGSFRTNLKSTNDSKSSDKQPMFMRAGSNNTSKKDGINNFLRSSDRKSPVASRKISSVVVEEPNYDSDMQAPLSRQLGGSRTSLDSLNLLNDDELDAPYIPDDDAWDSDLDAKDVPETWSELVDKKVQRKMHAKDIKRQDVIYELIQTEAVYVRVLQIMRKIYAKGMVNSLNMDVQVVDQIFPLLNDLIDLNGNFFQAMKSRQAESSNYCIENIGDILLDFFGGENGAALKTVYGYFCSRHLEAVALYKEYLKTDKKYSNFMKQCLLNDRSRRLSIPECITYVTIRMTKYPLLIEAIIKATKESKPDYEPLKKSLGLVKEVLVAVDEAVNIYEQEKELKALRKNLDRKNVVEIKIGNQKSIYRTTKLFHKRSRLLYDKKTLLKGKNKTHDARMIVLAEKIIFFQDSGGGKLQLLSADNKAPVLSLKNLMVREVATDNRALFLVSTSKDAAQIYEIVCDSYKDKKEWMPKLQRCIKECPDEVDDDSDYEEELRREEEERLAKLKEITEQLQQYDDTVANVLSDKNRLVHEMRELIESMDDTGQIKGSPCSELKAPDVTNARITLESCLNEVNLLSSTLCNQQVDAPIASPTPPPTIPPSGSTNSLTKRSDTFSLPERGMRSSYSYGNVSRVSATKPAPVRVGSGGVLETDSGKPRRQSQLLSVLTRTRTMGSTEDLSSISSSNSMTSLSTVSTTLSQMNLFQNLKDNLTSMVDVTNKQDTEIGKMRSELQESRSDILKLRAEKKDLEDKIVLQQKEHDKQMKHEKDQYAKLTREFKRTTDKLKLQVDEKKTQYQALLDAYNDLRMNSNSKDDGLFV